MRRSIALAVLVLVAVAATTAVAAARSSTAASADSQSADSAATRSIRIVEATDDHGVIRLQVRIVGWRMYPGLVGKAPKPGGGHWRIYVNGRYDNISTSATRGSTNPKRRRASGSYRIRAALAENNSRELRPPVRSNTVTVEVEAPPVTTETTE